MSNNPSASQEILASTLYVSNIDISLARDSRKTIGSIKLGTKNVELVKDVQKVIRAGGMHRVEFDPPLLLDPDDHVSVSLSCSLRMRKRVDVAININLRDVECMRGEQGVRSYRKKLRNIEVVVTGVLDQQSLVATTTQIIQSCSQFRLLIIGNSGVGKSSLIRRVFGVKDVHTSDTIRGSADIDREFVSPTNERFVVHDSLGFEAGDEENMDIVKEFVARRKAMARLKDQLHAVWLCLEIPYSGGRLLEAGVEKFLQRRNEILGKIPLVVVLTKVDLLDTQLELDLPANEDPEHYKSRYLDEHCITPLRKVAGSDVTHVTVSSQDGYSESLSCLYKVTDENMAKYHVDEAPRVVATIAQRISIKEKLELSIALGKKRYWKTLWKSAFFRGHTLKECLQVIRRDIITVWNFNDPDECLLDDNITEALLRIDNLGDTPSAQSNIASFADLLLSGFELFKNLSESGDVTLIALAPALSAVISVVQTTYETYQEAKRDVKILMAYIVDLICVMQAIFLIASGDRVTSETAALAVRAYEKPRKIVHLMVDAFDGKLGVLPGGWDHVLEKIEALIWRHSIADHEIEELRWKIGVGRVVLPSDSS
ncbi:hypothetical protein J3R82DRAFT_6077 [Butyriboletus roseoflavus]|nr:hypothetical protein J3R82DRAFT_6077 [Butyriboletus roseoflavus]